MRSLVGQRVRVYRNLRAGKNGKRVYSVLGSNGRLIAHVEQILLQDATFVVRPAGQAKVRREHKKNVHAFVVGTVVRSAMGIDASGNLGCRVSYNPYTDKTFVCEIPPRIYIKDADACVINQQGVSATYVNGERF